MNKLLLVWNLVLTLFLAGVVIIGCGPQYDYTAEIRTNREALEQLSALSSENRAAISRNNQAILLNKVAIETSASATTAAIKVLEIKLTQYVVQYVEAYVSAYMAQQ